MRVKSAIDQSWVQEALQDGHAKLKCASQCKELQLRGQSATFNTAGSVMSPLLYVSSCQ